MSKGSLALLGLMLSCFPPALPQSTDVNESTVGTGELDGIDSTAGVSELNDSTDVGPNPDSLDVPAHDISVANDTTVEAETLEIIDASPESETASSSDTSSTQDSLLSTDANSDETISGREIPCEDLPPAPVGMRCIEGGTFVDGGVAGGPGGDHEVKTFWLDSTEVTVAAYRACKLAGTCTDPDSAFYLNWDVADRDNHPINGVDWFQATDYCAWANKRLPSEWEWEWAARGRTASRAYPWGDEQPTCTRAIMNDESAGGGGCGTRTTAPVGSRPTGQSRDGVLDLVGSVWEWTSSWRDATQESRVLRGGGWDDSNVVVLSVAWRIGIPPSGRGTMGFRCAKDP